MKNLVIVLMILISTSAFAASEQVSSDTLNCVLAIAVKSAPGVVISKGRFVDEAPTYSLDAEKLVKIAMDSSSSLHKALVSYCENNGNVAP